MTVNAKVENLSSEAQENLVTFMKNKFGTRHWLSQRLIAPYCLTSIVTGMETMRVGCPFLDALAYAFSKKIATTVITILGVSPDSVTF